MKKKYKLKKGAIIFFIIIGIVLLSIIILLYNALKTKSYTLNYDLKEFSISENYDKKKGLYYYEIEYNKVKYNFINSRKYVKERKLIEDIKKFESDGYTCLLVYSDYVHFNPLCSKDKTVIDYHLVPEDILTELKRTQYSKEMNTSYKNYEIKNINQPVLIWNYKGFDLISKDKMASIKLFNKDIYNIKLAVVVKDYLFIPDYNQNYNFNKAYVIDLKKLTKKEWDLDNEISFDSYILGIHEDSIFLVDKKNKKEYELVPYNRKMRIVGTNSKKGIIYNNDKETKISLTKLTSEEQSFTYDNNYKFIIKDNTLYLQNIDSSIKTKISNNTVDKIVYINNDNVYYLVKDTLYFYNLTYGEVALITYPEWEFNNDNVIFIH